MLTWGDTEVNIASKLAVPKLMATILVFFVLLVLSVWLNIWQVGDKARAVREITAKLSVAQATADADRSACEATNQSANASITVLEGELLACRGQEQKLLDQRDLAMRQRARALKAAEGELQMRRTAIEAIARGNEGCNRSVCRTLSDELLGTTAEARDQ